MLEIDEDKGTVKLVHTYFGRYRIEIPDFASAKEANEIAEMLRKKGYKISLSSETWD